MQIEQSRKGDVVTLLLSGDCTVAAARELREALGAALGRQGPVVLDISGVGAADLTFIQLLLAADAFAHSQGGSLTLAGPLPDDLARVITLCGAHRRQEFRALLVRSGLVVAD